MARAAGTSGASVVRLAGRLGLDGFADLQDRVRADLTRTHRQAAERIRRPAADDPLAHTIALVGDAVLGTLDRVDRDDFDRAVTLLADRSPQIYVLAADASRGIGEQFVTELGMLRPGVTQVPAGEVAAARVLATLEEADVVVALDLPRYDRWLVRALDRAAQDGARIVALTDSALSPLAARAVVAFVVSAEAPGPFDSHLAALALLESLTAGVALRLRHSAIHRLARIEAAWTDEDALSDE